MNIPYFQEIIGATTGGVAVIGFLVYRWAVKTYMPMKYILKASDKVDSIISLVEKQISKIKLNPDTKQIGEDLQDQLIVLIEHKITNLEAIKADITKA